MDNWGDFLRLVVASSAGTTVLLGSAAYLLRTQISHWLNKDLEAIKAAHQRELEAYKVGLIAAAELAKSQQAVKTARALRIADKQFEALDRLHKAVLPYAALASQFLRFHSATRNSDFAKLNAAMSELTDAIRHARIFLSNDETKVLHSLQAAFVKAIAASRNLLQPMSFEEADALEEPLFELQVAANAILDRHIAAMLDMS